MKLTSTLEALQRLDDAEFHLLCDELIPRIDFRYRLLTPHGINREGQSIRGQPDSFIGDSITTAKIAIGYSVQKHRWWTKLVDDARAARVACPSAKEIVWATSRDTERDEGRPAEWLSDAQAACGSATLTLFGGRVLSQLLDTEHQDLRIQYLRIPHSRQSYGSVLTAIRQRTEGTIATLQTAGRYDPHRYVVRRADQTLFEIWAACGRASLARIRPRLIPLVSEAGLGKTSLLCRFAESFASRLPVLFAVARDIAWDNEDAIVRHVTQAAEGVLEPQVRSGEEQALARILKLRWPLTVVLDGLDETHEPDRVRRALQYWFTSRLAEESTLVVSSRPQFWILCEDPTWRGWVPIVTRRADGHDREASSDLRGVGFSLPELLSARELEAAWTRAGRPVSELAGLTPSVRAELNHPFTLRAFLESGSEGSDSRTLTRASVLNRWIDQRLRAEAMPAELLTVEVFRQALIGLAHRLQGSHGWVKIDDLHALPRFDPVHPPGPAIQRLAAAGLLDVSSSGMEVRFGHESIADFFLGELDASRALEQPEQAADELLNCPYSRVILRLEVVGRHVQESSPPIAFVERLARVDPARAIAVMQGHPLTFDSHVRAHAVTALAAAIPGRLEARAAFAVDVLGRFGSIEARKTLAEHLHPVDRCPEHLRSIAALAVGRAGISDAADVTYSSPLFGGSEPYYFSDVLHVLRGSDDAFREALARLALRRVEAEPGTKDHIRSVSVLGYLGDDRLVEYLDGRFDAAAELAGYENRALIAVGTAKAAQLFAKSAKRAAAVIAGLGWDDGGSARSNAFDAIAPVTADLPHLFTPQFEGLVREWLLSTSDVPREESAATHLKLMAISLARTSRSRNLTRLYVMAKEPYADHLVYEPVLDWLEPQDWSHWWEESKDEGSRHALIRALPGVPTPAVESALVEALRHRKLAWHAARYLGDAASWIGKTALCELVADTKEDERVETCIEAVRALGKLRDHDAVEVLSDVARAGRPRLADSAMTSLGLIGTPAAETALTKLLDGDHRVQLVAGALVLHGSRTATQLAIELASSDPARGSQWLVKAVDKLLSGWGWRRGEYFAQIHDDFGEFLRDNEPQFAGSEHWEYFRFLERFDTHSIRGVLRVFAQRRGTESDPLLRDNDGLRASRLAYSELFERGDSWALPELVRQCTSGDLRYGRYMAGELLRFKRQEVADIIRTAIADDPASATRVELIRLLGFFGAPSDVELIECDVESAETAVANAADEAVLRLTDPLRLPDNWNGLRY